VADDPGYREDELGELRSTIPRLTNDEILRRVEARAIHEIQFAEDQRIIKELDRAIIMHLMPPPPGLTPAEEAAWYERHANPRSRWRRLMDARYLRLVGVDLE